MPNSPYQPNVVVNLRMKTQTRDLIDQAARSRLFHALGGGMAAHRRHPRRQAPNQLRTQPFIGQVRAVESISHGS